MLHQAYTSYRPGAFLSLAGSVLALAELFFLPLATISPSSTATYPLTEWSLLTSNPAGISNALVATLIIISILLLTINLTILSQHVSRRFLILARLLAITVTIMQAILCLLILFSTTIIPTLSGQATQITSTSLGLLLVLSFLMITIGAFLTPLPLRK